MRKPFSRAAVAAVAGLLLLACVDRSDRTAGPQVTEPQFAVSQSQEAQSRVMAIQNRHTERLMTVPGVVGTATGLGSDGRPVVLVLTRADGVVGLPTSLEGAPVEIRVTGDITVLPQDPTPAAGGRAAAQLKTQIRPVPNGVSVSNNNECAAGTLGAALLIGGVPHALSNNHVFARQNAADPGEPIVQPGRYDNKPKCTNEVATDAIGTLADFEPIVVSTDANNVMDAAVAVATSDLSCSTPEGFYGSPSATTAAPSLGLLIQKVGRTSGLTTGTIAGINATVNVGYRDGTARFVNQIITSSRFSRGGDSGALIVTNDGTSRPVGLLFAGTRIGITIANPIDPVLERFGAVVCSL